MAVATDLYVRAVTALVGMVIQDLGEWHDDSADMLREEYGILPPLRPYISIHLGFHAEALRFLGEIGVMDIDDRGGRLVLGRFVRSGDELNFAGIIEGWEDTETGRAHIAATEDLRDAIDELRAGGSPCATAAGETSTASRSN